MYPIKAPVYQAQQIRKLEQLAKERFHLSVAELMQRAGKAAFDFLRRRWPSGQRLAIFCGSGNNGGDGYVLAKLAQDEGLTVIILQVGKPDQLKGEARAAEDACLRANIPIYSVADGLPGEVDVVVDAICGVGLCDALRDEVIAAIQLMENQSAPILAIDVPTGVIADTGEVLGPAVHATATITFAGFKLGLLTGKGIAYTGELVVDTLQLPAELFSMVLPVAERTCLDIYANYLSPRARDWHKGLSGHVLVIGGDDGMSGAVRLAAEAALRVGAGLVSIATRPEHAAAININRPEIMCHGVSDEKQLAPLLAKADVIILGPGLGCSSWAKMLWALAMKSELPLVVDADGLNILSETDCHNQKWVLTPHPGEAARLLHSTSELIQKDRLAAIKAICQQYGGICVLKGAGSLILSPQALPAICDQGNPGMASAGMGDVLSGVIGGLMAQGIPLQEAAELGVCLHAAAGDAAARGGERGMIATDLMPYLRLLSN